MKSPTQTIQYRSANNTRPCEVSGCAERRFGVSNFCLSHYRAKRAHGHPLGARIWPRDYAQERAEVARILREQCHYFDGHCGYRIAQQLIERGCTQQLEVLSSATLIAEG